MAKTTNKRRPAKLQPPRPLGEQGQRLWDAIQAEYAVTDAGGVEMLALGCEALDASAAYDAAINKDGAVQHLANGALKEHPLVKHSLAAKAFAVRTIEKLGLNFEAVKPVGRPGSPLGWKGSNR